MGGTVTKTSSSLWSPRGPRETEYTHRALDDEFTRTYILEELPRAYTASEFILGARCRLRSGAREAYFVVFQHQSNIPTVIQFCSKAETYGDLSKRRSIPAELARLPPPDASWTNLHSKKTRGCRIWIVTEFVPRILSRVAWEGCALLFLSELVQAVRSLHKAGYMHGDIAPPNIGFRADGSLVLIDLGAARRVEFFPPGEGIETTSGHPGFMSVVQHGMSVLHPADDVENCAYVALWVHTGRIMDSPEAKTVWMDVDGGDGAEQEIRRIARKARDASRHEPPPDDMYAIDVRASESCLLDERESSASEGQLSEEISRKRRRVSLRPSSGTTRRSPGKKELEEGHSQL